MDNNEDHIVISLKQKFDIIVDLLNSAEEERNKLIREKRELTEQVKLKTIAFKEMKRKYDSLKVAKTIVSSDDEKHDAKIKVNRIVREIDKCIALLNR